MEFQDKTLKCVDCGADFIFTAGEQLFFHDKQFKNEPKRCKACKGKRAAQVGADSGQSVFVESLTPASASASNVPAGMSADDLNEAGLAALKNQNFRAASELLKRVVELEPKLEQDPPLQDAGRDVRVADRAEEDRVDSPELLENRIRKRLAGLRPSIYRQ